MMMIAPLSAGVDVDPMAGYSGTPLAKKLGIAAGHRVKTHRAPPNYKDLLAPLPEGVTISARLSGEVDVWHLFAKTRRELSDTLGEAIEATEAGGIIWISWPKKASGVPTDVTEDRIRELVLPLGLVDVKVCAVDETWSGLKLVRRKTRPSRG
jgi:hypothetical protein